MSFVWPSALVGLVAVPLAVLGYARLLRRRAARVAALAAQGFVLTAAAARRRRLRHVPFALFLAALTLLLVALARPEASVSLPRREGTVILAFDVSSSMVATDLAPSRLRAAQDAATRFVERQPDSIRIGVVAFSDGGLVTQAVTDSRPDVIAAIERLSPQGGTSLGQGIFTALGAIAGKPIVLDDATVESGSLDDVEIGFFGSAAIVLLSDGENTAQPDPQDVAELASVAGVNIHTIGIGSPEGSVVEIEGFSVATALDEETLTAIATVTDGTYSAAADPEALAEVYAGIDLEITAEADKTEITGLVAGVSALLVFLGAALSLGLTGRVV